MTVIDAVPTTQIRRPSGPLVVHLQEATASDGTITGAKASALAKAIASDLPVMPGFVVTTTATAILSVAPDDSVVRSALEVAYDRLSDGGRRAVVVRSSSTVEDGAATSMAGMFTSLLDVVGAEAFHRAVLEVIGSAKTVPGIELAPIAVLVQPQLEPRFGGVLFGADPVTGRRDRLVVAAVEGGPDQLVSGLVDGAQYSMTRRGRQLSAENALAGFGGKERRALAALADTVARVFDGPQDVEWAIEVDGSLRLLQSRPITTAVDRTADATGPILGPGPVAETFPEALSTLEQDLWVEPLRAGVREAVRLSGAVTTKRLESSPVVTSIGGRVAADLELLGISVGKRSLFAKLDPRPPARRLRAAWRVGRLRAAFPVLARELVEEIDARLLELPSVDDMTDAELLGLLARASDTLVALHGHEVLAGLLVPATSDGHGASGAAVAMHLLAAGRAQGMADDEIIGRTPAVLALVPPRVGPAQELPIVPASVPAPEATGDDDSGVLREALRMRVRWVHELQSRAAWQLGIRLADAGVVASPESVRCCSLDELRGLIAGSGSLIPLCDTTPVAAPLPATFRMTADGEVVPVKTGKGTDGGRGAGGGRAAGEVVHHQPGTTPAAGSVLVVQSLDPQLASVLPNLGGLVAETGSVLSHLAILAREFGVATVVGVPDALTRFAPGSVVVVDGTTGQVELETLRGAA